MSEETKEVPKIGSVEWTPYVLSLLTEEEKYQDYPTVNGLRRLVEELIGEIVDIVPQPVVSTPEIATTVVTITVENNGKIKNYGGLADCSKDSCLEPYNKFLAAMADTRAEGRALRRALKLNVATAEELPTFGGQQKSVGGGDIPFSDDSETISTNQPANSVQFKTIDTVASRANINVESVLISKGYNTKGLTFEQAKDVLKELQAVSTAKGGVSEAFLGYKQNWLEVE